ncbi:uncharacterized protein ATNIH1004_007334 [Aspergillus tanneri]|uniref:Major facilitator superfamily (MFS) profile domain-containing protein n=1 Tax=Aspergillus tanneri TaxID=1220188 RepID=A0A5M9MLR8_9EURO|nr:uncharacterized protein ATNIH1004_007334 [Aspergillus tanneri]KAA8645913.1 hypothetical protein ATNIH1004_007334 [Aspergillus tanneri]
MDQVSGRARAPSLQMPPRYILASILTAMGGFLLGIDTSIIGPVTVMPSYVRYFGSFSSSVHGIIVSSILLSASVMSVIAGRPADVFGRPQGIALGAAVFGVGAALEAGAVRLAMFMVGRVIEGMGFGLYFGTLTVVLLYLPPSPRWLRLHGRHADAEAAWEILGVKPEDRERIEEDLEEGTRVRASDGGSTSSQSRTRGIEKKQEEGGFFDLFKKDVRGRTMLAVFLMGFLQLSGIDAVLYYAPLLFQQAGLTNEEASFLASGVSGIVLVVISVPALLLADKWGRRTSTIVGGLGLTITILLIGTLYATNSVYPDHGAARWIVIVCIYLYSAFFASTWAVSIKVFAPEIQPQHTRAKATALAHGLNWVCNWFVAFICPILLAKNSSAAYFLFGGCCALTTIVCFFFMIETKGKSLDEIVRAFTLKNNEDEGIGLKMGKAILRVFRFGGEIDHVLDSVDVVEEKKF